MGDTDDPVLNIILRELRELRGAVSKIELTLAEQRGAQKTRAAIWGAGSAALFSIIAAVVKQFIR